MNTDNLPQWNGAESAYSKAYRWLSLMAKNGCVKMGGMIRATGKGLKGGKLTSGQCFPNDDMLNRIKALNDGDEEQIKFYFHLLPKYYNYLN